MLSAMVSYSYSSSGSPAARGAVGIIALLLSVPIIIGTWKLFKKAGVSGWWSIVPIASTYFMFKISRRPWPWMLLYLVPFANWIIYVMMMVWLGEAFNKSVGFKVGLVLLPFIFVPIMGFDDSQYAYANVPYGGGYSSGYGPSQPYPGNPYGPQPSYPPVTSPPVPPADPNAPWMPAPQQPQQAAPQGMGSYPPAVPQDAPPTVPGAAPAYPPQQGMVSYPPVVPPAYPQGVPATPPVQYPQPPAPAPAPAPAPVSPPPGYWQASDGNWYPPELHPDYRPPNA